MNKMGRVIPNPMQYKKGDEDAKKPKSVMLVPLDKMVVTPTGFYIFLLEESSVKTSLWLIFMVFLAFFFLLFRVWPEWLRLGVWYVSWYLLVFLIATAIVRVIVWFLVWHIGIDFWIFPNYFIDSDNPLDTFLPVFSLNTREDMTDFRMIILRLGSAAAIFYGASEFLKDPSNLEEILTGGDELMSEMYDWGHNKFMGIADNSTQIEVKKSARQIYAEAFMEDEGDGFRTSTQFVQYADDDAVKEANEKYKADMDAAARARFAEGDDDEDDEEEALDLDSKSNGDGNDQASTDDSEDLLDKLTGNVDDDEEDLLDKLTGNIDDEDEDV